MKRQVYHRVFVSSLLNPSGENGEYLKQIYRGIEETLEKDELHVVKNTSDIWIRDYMPIQIDENTFVTYWYKPDYLSCKERHKYITTRFSSPEEILKNKEKNNNKEELELPFYRPDVTLRECRLILDGGNVVVCGNKIILTDKVFIENRPKTPDYVIGELKRAFGKEVIIIPSDPYEIEEARNNDNKPELPLCHADGVLAPIDNETILIADYGKDPLGYVPQLMNALVPYFKPENIKHFDFGEDWTEDSWVYINFLSVGDLVLMPIVDYVMKSNEHGKETIDPTYQEKLKRCNVKAEQQLKTFLGVDKIVAIDTTTLSLGKDKDGNEINSNNYGGALHCVTWEVSILPYNVSNPD